LPTLPQTDVDEWSSGGAQNTVPYRVQRAEDLRGQPLSEGRLDVEVALAMCATSGSALGTVPGEGADPQAGSL